MHMCARVCTCVRMCARVCACVISGISIIFRIFSNLLNTHSFYTHFLPQFLSCGTIFLFIFIVGDVAQSGAFDALIKLKPLIVI